MEANVRPESPGAIKNDAATRSDGALHHACLRNPNGASRPRIAPCAAAPKPAAPMFYRRVKIKTAIPRDSTDMVAKMTLPTCTYD